MTLFNANTKKLIQIDISSDTVCPWCFVGRKNLGNAMDLAKDRFNFELRWHPFFLDPSAPKEGIKKSDHYKKKFGDFRGFGLEYDTCGLTGNTLDSHRLISFAGGQGYDKQDLLVQELFQNYFIDGKYINDQQVLIDAAQKVGIEGAAEFLEDPNKGLDEVNGELEKYSGNISGVPNYLINGKHQLHGGQSPEAFLRAFEYA